MLISNFLIAHSCLPGHDLSLSLSLSLSPQCLGGDSIRASILLAPSRSHLNLESPDAAIMSIQVRGTEGRQVKRSYTPIPLSFPSPSPSPSLSFPSLPPSHWDSYVAMLWR